MCYINLLLTLTMKLALTTMSTVDSTPPEVSSRTDGIVS